MQNAPTQRNGFENFLNFLFRRTFKQKMIFPFFCFEAEWIFFGLFIRYVVIHSVLFFDLKPFIEIAPVALFNCTSVYLEK